MGRPTLKEGHRGIKAWHRYLTAILQGLEPARALEVAYPGSDKKHAYWRLKRTERYNMQTVGSLLRAAGADQLAVKTIIDGMVATKPVVMEKEEVKCPDGKTTKFKIRMVPDPQARNDATELELKASGQLAGTNALQMVHNEYNQIILNAQENTRKAWEREDKAVKAKVKVIEDEADT